MRRATRVMSLRMEPGLHREAQRAAAAGGMVLTAWIRQAMAEKIARDRQRAAAGR